MNQLRTRTNDCMYKTQKKKKQKNIPDTKLIRIKSKIRVGAKNNRAYKQEGESN